MCKCCCSVSCLPEVPCSHETNRAKARWNRELRRDTKEPLVQKALPPDISPYQRQATSFHPFIIAPVPAPFLLRLLPFAFLLLPDIPILPSFYAALSLPLLFVGFCPCHPPNPQPPLPSFSSSWNLPPCLSFSSSTAASRATDSPLCLSVFFHSHHLVLRAFS